MLVVAFPLNSQPGKKWLEFEKIVMGVIKGGVCVWGGGELGPTIKAESFKWVQQLNCEG